jgi:hypothetical protein
MTSSDEISGDVQIAQSTNQKRRLIKPNLAHVNIEFTSSIELPKNVQIHWKQIFILIFVTNVGGTWICYKRKISAGYQLLLNALGFCDVKLQLDIFVDRSPLEIFFNFL